MVHGQIEQIKQNMKEDHELRTPMDRDTSPQPPMNQMPIYTKESETIRQTDKIQEFEVN